MNKALKIILIGVTLTAPARVNAEARVGRMRPQAVIRRMRNVQAITHTADNATLIRPTVIKITLAGLLIAAATAANAEQLGRLFFTPEQRAQLERGQRPDIGKPDNIDSLTVNGIVQKHGGERTVWINGVPQPAGKSDERAPESVPVAIPGQSTPARVKVGQKVIVNPAATEK